MVWGPNGKRGLRLSDTIRFLLGDRPVEIADCDPNLTVLEWLRGVGGRCGTKEGCAEGDCGACTVVLAEPDGSGGLAYRSVNSCIQFVGTLDGTQLLTVEDLKQDGALHPVQQAMVEAHASQCGFCTPGFVMSLFKLYRDYDGPLPPSRETLDRALGGNLCRCTGYRSILEAATRMFQTPRPDGFDAKREATLAALAKLVRGSGLAYRDRFFAPATLAELQELLGRHPSARILSGGTDLGLEVTKAHRTLETMIYLGRVAGLDAISRGDGRLTVGAAATWTQAARELAAIWPGLDEIMARFAGPPIRNAGTVGGNIANASPIGDGPPIFLALDAEIDLLGPKGTRRLNLADFFLDYRKTARLPGEIVARLHLPLPKPGALFAAYKVSKRHDDDISAVCGVFALEIVDGRIAQARAAFGGMAAIPKRAAACEAALLGQVWSLETAKAAGAALAKDFAPIDDMRASAAYRLKVAANLLQRFWFETATQNDVRAVHYA
jgi:xanthine dehydrogenase small subunit